MPFIVNLIWLVFRLGHLSLFPALKSCNALITPKARNLNRFIFLPSWLRGFSSLR